MRMPAIPFILLTSIVFGLSACVAPPPRERVVYHEGGDQSSGPRYCHTCGTVRDVDQVEIRQQNSGGGAVIGAIIGGLIGNQFGRGGGRAAATAAGVIAGAAVGNATEENNARLASGYAWRFTVQLDDGRWAKVTQYDNPGFHPGDRVVVRGQHLEFMRR
ncbi:MAG: glycine zipper 2TM domain-containing protein [Xanthomonadaceae bacterium]|nr:glycine zipper 2TM domain-containing protein [Xanthomonadaceae bacterium]MDE1961187.1 glycine zipper 2TM domain-containing protein [Xanthomonadaceae bacterium]MDE2084119.1 glycine zipper 2TM domain-containing protein [Xanthomonadaceae bacterium]MDE2258261.1 glycine zipper 2TM domain-containing protein [Xanthomonadaceae bacterium]